MGKGKWEIAKDSNQCSQNENLKSHNSIQYSKQPKWDRGHWVKKAKVKGDNASR